jgi:hypothetical protein
MEMKRFIVTLMVLLAAAFFAACGSSPTQTQADLTGVTSYYVRANGNDSNAGTSENAPFRTLERAVRAALSTPVKKITVIGTLDEDTTIKNTKPPVLSTERDFVVREFDVGGQRTVVVDTTQPAPYRIKSSYDERDPEEILITGKPDATGNEKAVLTNSRNADNILRIENATIRLENIEISGFVSTNSRSRCIRVWTGVLTLGQGAKVTNNKVIGVHAINGGVVIMRDNAEISSNQSVGGNTGVYLETGSVMVMLNNAVIKENAAIANNNGDGSAGGVAITKATLIMRGNSTISNNRSPNFGGGVMVYDEDGLIEMFDNAVITGNTASIGAGVALVGTLDMNDAAQITNNSAVRAGGGVYGEGDTASISVAKTAVLSNNRAPQYPDTNFTFN